MSAIEREIWLDGSLVPWEACSVHVLSQSLQRGSLVFDVMPCVWHDEHPRVFGLREHVDRFLRSADLNGMSLEHDRDALVAAIGRTLAANPGAELVKISAYHAGISLDVLPPTARPSVAIAAFAAADIVAPETLARFHSRPARLQIAEPIKMPATVLSPQVKIAAGYTHAAVAKQRARESDFDDVLFLDERGRVAESSTQSFFLVAEGLLRTAPTDTVLDGITRRCVIELILDEGMGLKEAPIPRELLDGASEAFLTGTSTNVWGVSRIDTLELPEPVPGPLTARLAERLQRLLDGDDPVFSPRWMQEPR